MPAGYIIAKSDGIGYVLSETGRQLSSCDSPKSGAFPSTTLGGTENRSEVEEEERSPKPITLLQEEATFDELNVWGHDQVPAADDDIVKGIEEYIGFAETVSLFYCGAIFIRYRQG